MDGQLPDPIYVLLVPTCGVIYPSPGFVMRLELLYNLMDAVGMRGLKLPVSVDVLKKTGAIVSPERAQKCG